MLGGAPATSKITGPVLVLPRLVSSHASGSKASPSQNICRRTRFRTNTGPIADSGIDGIDRG